MTRLIALSFIFAAILLGGLFSGYSAYMSCYNSLARLDDARSDLLHECEGLCSLVPMVGALTMRYLPGDVEHVERAEVARVHIEQKQSIPKVAYACFILHSSLKEMLKKLGRHHEAAAHYRYDDVKTSFTEISSRLLKVRDGYNQAVHHYNAVLDQPLPHFWNGVFRYPTADVFAVSVSQLRAVRTTSASHPD